MNVLLIPVGSSGDVHPFVGLGLALRGRGHRVTIVTNAKFEPLARRVGLEFLSVGTEQEMGSIEDDPDLWHPHKGFGIVAKAMLELVPRVYEVIEREYLPGETVVAAAGIALGARLAQEKLGVPLATVQLQPSVFRSVYQMPVYPRFAMPAGAPRFVKAAMYWVATALVADRALAPGLNAIRARLGLPPVREIVFGWWNSPQRVIAMFPDWFGPPQPDWPPQTVLTGFPLYDERGAAELPEGLDAFLEAGDPPIVFTPGSAMRHGRPFFEAAVAACRALGRRGLLLTRFPELLPPALPGGIRHFAYIPFSQILPRAAALVHHGGIGTSAQGLAAGVPQLVMPMSHDQPDNAARLERLGVGRSLPPRRFRGPAVARALDELLASTAVAARCREIVGRFPGARALDRACEAIEGLTPAASRMTVE